MDENEYLQRFRLAILWDEFRRREMPYPKRPISTPWSGSRRERDTYERRARKWLYQGIKRFYVFDWVSIFVDAANVELYARWVLRDGPNSDYLGSLRLTTWSLRQKIEHIKDIEVRDYYEHLIFVAEETLKVMDSR